MRCISIALLAVLLASCGCTHSSTAGGDAVKAAAPAPVPGAKVDRPVVHADGSYRGFDRNDYPGDATMAAMHGSFTFTGYWLTNPPGETANSWLGKRALLETQGWGFLVLANGRLDAEILKSQKRGTPAAAFARSDAAAAIAAAKSEGFPARTILFLDQEEGGRLLDEQAGYLLAWTEAVAGSGFLPGVYASGQPVPDGPGRTLTTVEDIRSRVQADHLHPVAMFAAQDACPPAPGCTLEAKPLAASGLDMLSGGGPLIAWQYSQSPRRPEITTACKASYAADGNCYATGFPTVFLDLDTASSADPSHGR